MHPACSMATDRSTVEQSSGCAALFFGPYPPPSSFFSSLPQSCGSFKHVGGNILPTINIYLANQVLEMCPVAPNGTYNA